MPFTPQGESASSTTSTSYVAWMGAVWEQGAGKIFLRKLEDGGSLFATPIDRVVGRAYTSPGAKGAWRAGGHPTTKRNPVGAVGVRHKAIEKESNSLPPLDSNPTAIQ